jgi:D-alanyl-D-alanine carboxypeptidase/D-alanyl-D-alanine-endopeptidase (penicillin-binding protein 4)
MPRPLIRFFLLALGLASVIAQTAAADDLPDPVKRVLAGHGLSSGGLSIVVQPVDGGDPLLEYNGAVPRNPASVMKLVSSFVALDVLGPAHTWDTSIWLDGDLDPASGRLDGNLVIRGGGDPWLTLERFWTLLRDLRAKGLRDIDGDLVLDRSLFDLAPVDPGAFDGQPLRAYNVGPDPFLVNLKAVRFTLVRRTPGGRPDILVEPPLANLRLINQVRSAKGPCRGYQRGVSVQAAADQPGTVILSGRFPTGCSEYSLYRSVMEPDRFAWGVFQSIWTELGGSISGVLRNGTAPGQEKPFHIMRSIPAADVVQRVNKFSNNVMARILVLTAGVAREGEPATLEKGRRTIDAALRDLGVPTRGLFIENGSGLSRESRMSARTLGGMLVAAWAHRYMPEFAASMPVSGEDGTLRRRLGGTTAGYAHMKTGRLQDVSSIAGYVQTRGGRRYAVVVLHNDEDVHRGPGQELQDALVRWVHDR